MLCVEHGQQKQAKCEKSASHRLMDRSPCQLRGKHAIRNALRTELEDVSVCRSLPAVRHHRSMPCNIICRQPVADACHVVMSTLASCFAQSLHPAKTDGPPPPPGTRIILHNRLPANHASKKRATHRRTLPLLFCKARNPVAMPSHAQ